MKVSEILPSKMNRLWHFAKQCGATNAVSRLPRDADNKTSFEYMDLLHMKMGFEDFGIKLLVIEPGIDGQMHQMKLGLKDRDKDIENLQKLIFNMGLLKIPVLCYNFMAGFNWVRTSVTTVSRGGAFVTSYDHSYMENAPLTSAGIVGDSQLWDNLYYMLERIIPVAEESKVRLALHPDDPPVSPIRGISRILTNGKALMKAVDLIPSKYSGITLCQGTLAAAGEDICKVIEEFGQKKKIFFVHFRDIAGHAEKFSETFHDDGKTNMFETIKKYKEVGFNGPVRIDHVPNMEGEKNNDPGYGEIGRLFALGYLKGLLEGANSKV